MTWFVTALKRYADFSGRSRRKEYWMFVLFAFVISLGLGFIDGVIGTYDEAAGVGLLSGLFTLGVFVPSLSVTARRLHDIEKSGWLQLLFLIPLVGWILWLVWMTRESNGGANQYGPDPKYSPVTALA